MRRHAQAARETVFEKGFIGLGDATNKCASQVSPATRSMTAPRGKIVGLPTLCFVKELRRKFLLPQACKKFCALDNDGTLKITIRASSPLLRALIVGFVFLRVPRGISIFLRKV